MVWNLTDKIIDSDAEILLDNTLNSDNITIDNTAGENIPETFAKVYSKLYNVANDNEKVKVVEKKIIDMIGNMDSHEVSKITGITVKDAVKKIKSGKNDPVYDFSSDFLKNAPGIFYDNIATLIRAFLSHGPVPRIIGQ